MSNKFTITKYDIAFHDIKICIFNLTSLQLFIRKSLFIIFINRLIITKLKF